MTTMTMVKIYVTEADKTFEPIMSYLYDKCRMKGVTVLRAISGFGQEGKMHSAKLVEMSLNLPLVIEFFDETEKVSKAVEYIKKIVKTDHIIQWNVEVVD